MTTPLDDDVLGARLRAVLQDVTPLATDPLPPPRFAPAALADAAPSAATVDVIELGTVGRSAGPSRRRPRRRVAVATGVVLAAAAVVAGAIAVGADLPGRDTVGTPATGGGPSPVVPTGLHTVPDRDGAYLGVTPAPAPWRCTAPAGVTIAAVHDPEQFAPAVWTVSSGVTCAPFAADADRFAFSDNGNSASFDDLPAESEGSTGGSRYCLYVATATSPRDPSFVSRGSADYLEFFGPGCRLVLPGR